MQKKHFSLYCIYTWTANIFKHFVSPIAIEVLNIKFSFYFLNVSVIALLINRNDEY